MAHLGGPAALSLLTDVLQVSASQPWGDLCNGRPVLRLQVFSILLQDLGPARLVWQAKLHRGVKPADEEDLENLRDCTAQNA